MNPTRQFVQLVFEMRLAQRQNLNQPRSGLLIAARTKEHLVDQALDELLELDNFAIQPDLTAEKIPY